MYSDLVIFANNIQLNSSAARVACQYAERSSGTVTAIYTKLDKVDLLRWHTSSTQKLIDKMMADVNQQENDCRLAFEKLSKQFECETIWRTAPHYAELSQEVLCTDMVIVDQPLADDKRDPAQQSLLNSVILETKRPVLMIPKQWQAEQLPSKITLGWNSSAEAMRATSDALPFMLVCKHVDILCMMDDRLSQHTQAGIYQIKEYLTRKRIHNQLIIENCDKRSLIPEKFLGRAIAAETDLLVVGGYGHSRVREIILGGMTSYLIGNATMPVLFSH